MELSFISRCSHDVLSLSNVFGVNSGSEQYFLRCVGQNCVTCAIHHTMNEARRKKSSQASSNLQQQQEKRLFLFQMEMALLGNKNSKFPQSLQLQLKRRSSSTE